MTKKYLILGALALVLALNCSLASATNVTVTPSGTNVGFTPYGAQSVAIGSTKAFTVNPFGGYMLPTSASGTCPTGSWSGSVYTTGTITANCTVTFTGIPLILVSAGMVNGTISPSSGATWVTSGSTQAFTLTPNPGYAISTTVTGTCPAGGNWSSANTVYTTGSLTANCTRNFSATIVPYTLACPTQITLLLSPMSAPPTGWDYSGDQSTQVPLLSAHTVAPSSSPGTWHIRCYFGPTGGVTTALADNGRTIACPTTPTVTSTGYSCP